MLCAFLLTGSYSKSLKVLKDNLQRATIKAGMISRDIGIYKKNLSQVVRFSGGSYISPERTILQRIDILKSLYPDITIKPGVFNKREDVVGLPAEIIIKSKSYYRITDIIETLSNERLPLYRFSQIDLRPLHSSSKGGEIQCRINGEFLTVRLR
ncbi:MAG: hypothetical protein D6710_08580 [Nitrospirae bacterium]|nr:MAG: hypothetical protein D6710_08580 [Nitrospirota bacterium]